MVLNSPRRVVAILALAFVLAAAATLLFAVRVHRGFRAFHTQNEPIRAWMSIPFVAHAHHVPTSVLYEAVGVTPEQPRDHRSIGHIARELHREPSDIEAQLQRAIDANRHQGPGPQ